VCVLDTVREAGDIPASDFPAVVGRMSFFLNAGIRFVEEMAKVRVFGRMWDRICRERYGVTDPALRRRSHAGLNKGEARNALARTLFFHRHGEIRDRTFENQCYRASGLNLAVAAVILWNTVYLSRAVAELRSRSETLSDDLLAHIAPLGWEHISFNGDYVWPSEPLKDTFRPLRNPCSPLLKAA